MSTRINTNVTAFEAARNLGLNSDMVSKNIQRLSSGLRINSAADDAAGLVISENMQAQVTGLDQATRNSNDAINMIKTAEGALNEVHGLLMSMRQLAVHASNLGVNDATDIAADQTQINSAIQSLNRIASTTSFGTKKLLDGSASSAATTTAGTLAAGNGAPFGAQLSVVSQGTWNASAANQTVVTNGATKAVYSTSGGSATSTDYQGTIKINGASYTVGTAGSATGAVDLTALNAAIANSGFQAVAGTGAEAGQLQFVSQTAGKLANAPAIDVTGLNGFTSVDATGTATAFTGIDSAKSTNGADQTMTLNGSMTSVSTQQVGSTYYYTFQNGTVLSSTDTATSAAALDTAGAAQASGTTTNTSTLSSTAGTSTMGTDLEFQIGANEGQTASIGVQSTASDQIGGGASNYTDASGNSQQVLTKSVRDINVSTFKGAQDAIAVIDQAISQISTVRANLGAFQSNVLESNVRSLGVAEQNLKASESTIKDTDLSSEIVDFTKNQILVQAGTSALAQANQAPQAILKLLQ